MIEAVHSEIHGRAGLIRINRPAAINALNDAVVAGIAAAACAFAAEKSGLVAFTEKCAEL